MKTLLTACCSIGCLTIVLVGLLIYKLLFTGVLEKESNNEILDVNSGEVVLKAALVSDIENDFNNLEKFVVEINNMDVDIVFVLGDITSLGVKEDLLKAKAVLNKVEEPIEVYYIPGDRDLWKSSGIKNFKEVFGNPYRVVEKNNIKFLLLDNSNEYEGIDSSEMQFIRDNISNVNYVMFHNPIYFNKSILGVMGKGMGQYSEDVDIQRQELLEIVRSSNAVKATFSGDQHSYSITVDDQKKTLSHIILGSLNTVRNLDRPNFAIVEFYEDHTFKVEKIYLPINESDL